MENKTCTRCGTRKAKSEFHKDKYNKDGLYSHCKECVAEKWAAKPGRPRKGPKRYEPPKEKLCRGCDQTLCIDAFDLNSNRGGGRAPRPRCKQCCSKRFKSWSNKNPGSSRARNLKSKYNLTIEKYMEIFEAQDCKCGLCGATESGWKTSPWMHVDHDHKTGVVRGMLCHACNILIGCIEKIGLDKVANLESWIALGEHDPHDHKVA